MISHLFSLERPFELFVQVNDFILIVPLFQQRRHSDGGDTKVSVQPLDPNVDQSSWSTTLLDLFLSSSYSCSVSTDVWRRRRVER